MTVPVMVLHRGPHHNHHQNAEHQHGADKHHNLTTNTESAADPQVPILHFPKSSEGLKRRKRDWVIPPLSVSENHRGPYPHKIAQIRSDKDKTTKIHYSITGPGADRDPVDLFTMDRTNGNLFVTQELDREKQDKYPFQAHAVAEGGSEGSEQPMEIIVNVIDQNDNKPVFVEASYIAQVPEASKKGFQVVQVVATDADEENTDNSEIRYSIESQTPEKPDKYMFSINPVTGAIKVNDERLDRENYPQYELTVQVADNKGDGLTGSTKVTIKVTDSNDNAPVFTEATYKATVEENKVDAIVVRMSVTDGDEPHTPAWNAKFKIIDGDPGNLFNVTTGVNKQEGILKTVKGLDFEKVSKHTLLVAVENDVDFAVPLTTSTATVIVTVQDVNEAPIFDPKEKHVSKLENLAVGSEVVTYTAYDPDTARKQKVMYKILADRGGWLEVNKDTGLITVKSPMDRESLFVTDNNYTALIGAYDNDELPATGTGTVFITLQDVNDNAPVIQEREFTMCNNDPQPQLLSVTDKDGPGFTYPYSVTLVKTAETNWTAKMNGTKTGIILTLKTNLRSGVYHVGMSVSDNQGLSQVSTVTARVYYCTGGEGNCQEERINHFTVNLIKLLVVLLLPITVLLVLFIKWRRQVKNLPPSKHDNTSHQEGGGEEDQNLELSALSRCPDNQP
ncbi:cadherin-1-like [Kryptolebias marmoratus]|uniref:cadherin-1-like n=1 Tax=Kryptolebias marmoratus TaxID=37003 RepID=UPI0018ACC9D6|nr:cadherin-1-like [Kryptolebias marmoratus]